MCGLKNLLIAEFCQKLRSIFVQIFEEMLIIMKELDRCQSLSNCVPTPPLAQKHSTDDKLGLMFC